jgi:hypothetical protein
MEEDRTCDFCNERGDTYYNVHLPDKFAHNTFCKGPKLCYGRYQSFVYRDDLTNGIPYAILHEHPKILERESKPEGERETLQCGYCGKMGTGSVIQNPWAPQAYQHNSFCKNSSCYHNFIQYTSRDFPVPPYIMLKHYFHEELFESVSDEE